MKSECKRDSGGANQKKQSWHNLPMLSLGALGVVFGDIGTSPLYALSQCIHDQGGASIDVASLFGILSLIFWSLILMVCVKYVTFILQADNHGEGGTLAMLAMIHSKRPHADTVSPGGLMLLVFAGSALLYGDGAITPAISVLSAVEGLKIASPGLQHFIVPIALGILVCLFLLQSRGTEKVGNLFGPIMALWFLSIAALGVNGILREPRVLQAVNPAWGIQFLAHHGGRGIIVLGGVVLCFTGAEALFADMSHFGRRPIKLMWYGMVLPALVLNYFGEGALLVRHPTQIEMPFYALVPHAFFWPELVLATLATIIASQAVISGTFTLTEQGIHLGYLPRFEVRHTSKNQRGQVYVGVVNYALMAACAGIVLGFRSSERLGSAYGLAVIGTMTATSLTFYVVIRNVWKWPRMWCVLLVGFFLLMDLSFMAGNIVKVISGAWLPLLLGLLVFGLFWIWTECGARFHRALNAWSMPLEDFRGEMKKWEQRQEGTGIFLTTRPDTVPLAGRNHWLREVARHEQTLLVTVIEARVPYVSEEQMQHLEDLGNGLWRLTTSFGFMQSPHITQILKALPPERLKLDWDKLAVYLPEGTFEAKGNWYRRIIEQIYKFLRSNSFSAAQYFHVPPKELIHVGVALDLDSQW